MERNYMRSWLVGLAVLVCGAAVARAQEPPPVRMLAQDPALPRDQGPNINQAVQPLGPVDAGTVSDAQFFQQPDLTQIGTYPELNYGPYFQYERLYWSLHQPSTREIGDGPTAIADGSPNDNNTGFMNAGFVWGNRFDVGYRLEDETGWDVSILKTNTQFNTLIDMFPTNVTFINNEPLVTIPAVTPPPATIAVPSFVPAYPSLLNAEFHNYTRMVGVELMKSYRYPVQHNGGIWTIAGGVRFFQLHDRFDAVGQAAGSAFVDPTSGEIVTYGDAPISWDLGIDNNIVGPQIALGYEMENSRWTIGSSFRAMFGANFQNASEYGYTGGSFAVGGAQFGQPGEPSNNFFNKSNSIEFAPLGELRVDAEYKVTNNVSLKVGYTAILVTGIGRAANRIVYSLPDMGIADGGNKEHFFADGITVGFEINR
jgi:hypothetical protein